MKPVTLVTKRLYFGVDALRLRDATERVLSRVHGIPLDRAKVRLDALVDDFRVSAAASRAMVDEMVRKGLLQPLAADSSEYGITDKFRQYALANIVGPLPRTRAKMMLEHIADLALNFNHTAANNRYEIEVIAVYGACMSLDPDLADLLLGVTGRRRLPGNRPASGRATKPVEGSEWIRELFEAQSSFVEVSFFPAIAGCPAAVHCGFQGPRLSRLLASRVPRG